MNSNHSGRARWVGLLVATTACVVPTFALATPFLPNPAYLSASTQTDGIRFATNPTESPVDSKRTTIEGADLVSRFGRVIGTAITDTDIDEFFKIGHQYREAGFIRCFHKNVF